jgi:uncharacterized FAD-dependent dehydrogenase
LEEKTVNDDLIKTTQKTKGMTTTTNDSWYRWCPRPTRRSCFRSFSLRSSRSRRNATFTEGGRKKKNEFASKGIKPPMQSSSSSSKKTKKTKETRFSDEEKEEKSINETKTNGWRIFDVHIDASEDVGKDDFSISKPILERVCKVLHLDIEDIEDDIERKMKKTSIETILQRNDDEMMKQRIRVARKSCDARGGGGGGIARRTKTKNANDYHEEEEEDDDDKHRVQFSYVIDVSDEFVEMCGGSARRVRAERKKVERTKMEEKEEEKVDVNGFSRDDEFKEEKNKNKKRTVVIVGLGPAGLFCALTLARLSADTKVVILERGEPVERRGKAIGALFHRRRLSETSNLCYGEGGAGTWSDGKLTTRIGRNGEEVKDVFKTFVEFGAPPEILQMGKPHLGTDRMVKILRNARYELEKMGCEIMFDETCRTVMVEDNKAVGVTTESGKTIHAEAVVLATGHSSRALFEQLSNDGVLLEFQSFASGFRIEHPQELLNELQYGERFAKEVERGKGRIPVADYRVAHTNKEDNRGVFSFCMCPGGQIVPTSTNVHELCINGMSFSRRQSLWANSGLVTNIKLEDCAPFNDEHETKPHLSGILFQQDIERKAAVLGGGDLTVPVQTAHDFLLGVVSDEKSLPSSSYRLGIKSADLTTLYPQHLTEAIQFALKKFDKQMPGYAGKEALIHAPETRTSSPVRIVRNSESLESENTKNLFPIGEGAGYAGGIVSAAVDGMCASKKVLAKLLKVV